ncbi:MAG: M20/M25/M40 family metallo-hydrolase [Anaerolineae bacterium]
MTMNSDGLDVSRLLSLAQNLVQIPSLTGEETEAAKFLASYWQEVGLPVEVQAVRLPNSGQTSHQTIARWQGQQPGPKILLCGHLDVLEVYRPDRWSRPPYEATVTDGWLYGQGSLNMKAGLTALVSAVETLWRSDFPLRGELVIAAVMGEIIGGLGIRHLLQQERDFDLALVAEPTNLNLATISVGTVQGWLRLWGDTLYFKLHANPIYAMGKVLEAIGPPYEPLAPDGWMTFIPCADLPGFPRFNARKISSGQDYCEIFFDTRIVPGQNDDTLWADLTALWQRLEPDLPGIWAELIIPATPGGVNFPAMPAMPVEHPLAQALSRHHSRQRGQPPIIGAGDRIGLASDASHLRAAGIYTLEYGPGKHPRWPMWDERIAVEDVVTAAKVFIETLVELGG